MFYYQFEIYTFSGYLFKYLTYRRLENRLYVYQYLNIQS